ncbi:MAG: T9SS type A sorting domain-containing protein [Flavobacteriales bacterium]|nr:T9SS type A sorting domain-containing protein [Flavobacteriales bacterium]
MKKITLSFLVLFVIGVFNTQAQKRYKDEVFTDAQIQIAKGIKFGTNYNWLIINSAALAAPANGPQIVSEITELKTLLAQRKPVPTRYYLPSSVNDTTILKVQDLKMDAYMPDPSIDTASKRPIIIYLHTGNYLPPGINGSPVGARDDSLAVDLCKGFARRGFIAVSIDYRLGWNPIAPSVQERRGGLLSAVYRAIHDVKECVKVIKFLETQGNSYKFDVNKIALFGEGTGGYLGLAYVTLDKYAEMNMPKFQNPITSESYVDTAKFGQIDGSGGLFNLYFPNSVSTKVQVCANIGGALADSSWLEAGDPPLISMQSVRDPYAPFGYGTVLVPGTNLDVVDVDGANNTIMRAQRLGNNNVFVNIPSSDPYTIKARSLYNRTIDYIYPAPNDKITIRSGEGMYPVITPLGASVLQNQGSPWQWWDSASAIAKTIVSAGPPPVTAHQASIGSNPGMGKAKSAIYQDTIHGYITVRIAIAMGLLNPGDLKVKTPRVTGVSVYPNPTSNELSVKYNGIINSINIMDLNGKTVYSTDVNDSSIQINSLNLKSGFYITHIQTENGLAIEKLVVK